MNTWTLKDGRWEIRGIEELSADMFCVLLGRQSSVMGDGMWVGGCTEDTGNMKSNTQV